LNSHAMFPVGTF